MAIDKQTGLWVANGGNSGNEELKAEIASLKTEVASVKAENSQIKTEIANAVTELGSI